MVLRSSCAKRDWVQSMTSLNSNNYGRVAVVMGGSSAEREVSIKGAQAILNALMAMSIDAQLVDGLHQLDRLIQQNKVDRVFNILHGKDGEDGVLQSLLQVRGIPFTGSGVLASALTMDKYRTKCLWRGVGLPVANDVFLESDTDYTQHKLDYPCVVKPSREGSSIGVHIVESAEALDEAVKHARSCDSEVLIENYIDGGEYTCAILHNRALPIIKIETSRQFYDYEAKYHSDETRYLCPPGLSDVQELELKELSLRAFLSTGCTGWGRVDFMMDSNDRVYLIEINTVPGMTSHSLLPMAAMAENISFNSLVLAILKTSMESINGCFIQ